MWSLEFEQMNTPLEARGSGIQHEASPGGSGSVICGSERAESEEGLLGTG